MIEGIPTQNQLMMNISACSVCLKSKGSRSGERESTTDQQYEMLRGEADGGAEIRRRVM